MQDRKLLVGAVLGMAIGQAAAAPLWETVDINRERKVFLDRSTAVRDNGYAQAWERAEFAELQPGEHTGERFQSVQSLYRYDCLKRTAVPLLNVYYQADGSELRRVDVQGLFPERTVETDSVRSKLLVLACNPPSKLELAKAQVARKPAKPAPARRDAKDAPIQKAVFVKPAPEKPKSRAEARAAKPAKPAKPRTAARQKPAPDCPEAALVKAAVRQDKPAAPAAHWSYAGRSGPEHWSKLDPGYAQCASGARQSPIDIREGARLELEPIAFDYRPSPLRIVDNGHTVRVEAAPGSFISVGGGVYELKQLHFHNPAEEVVDGKRHALSAHLVHAAEDGRLAIVAVLFELSGQPNDMLRGLWPHLPLEQGRETVLPEVQMDWNAVLPAERGYYAYIGSLTTPPCTEGVLWLVMKTPVPVSQAQVDVFARLYPMNARPLQAANGRLIKESM